VDDRPRVVLATGNPGKLREMRAILAAHPLEVVPQSDFGLAAAEETGATFIANALIKARHASRLTGLPAIADDSGLEVDALGGGPGVLSARYAGPGSGDAANNELLLRELEGVAEDDRTARYRCAMVFVRHADDASPIEREATWEGRIALAPRGTGGFGYDPVFLPEGESRTAAQLDPEAKNRRSHRARALLALAQAMRDAGW
jgi:XTP/dITP diphosphohydrolase